MPVTHEERDRYPLGPPTLGRLDECKQQGILTRSPQWWKHLRDWKRVFWKSERQAQKKVIKGE